MFPRRGRVDTEMGLSLSLSLSLSVSLSAGITKVSRGKTGPWPGIKDCLGFSAQT